MIKLVMVMISAFQYVCRKGEHGRVLRMDQLNRDDMREVNEWQNVQNKKTQSTREEFETPSIQDSKSVSTTELLQFHLSCFRCNICHVILKERDGKRTLKTDDILNIIRSHPKRNIFQGLHDSTTSLSIFAILGKDEIWLVFFQQPSL